MTRFHKRPPVNGLDDPSGGERRRQAMHHRVEMVAALLIPGVVVGLPLLTNYSGATTAGPATSRPASHTVTDSTTVTDAGSALIAPEVQQTGDPAVDGLPTKADASFWDIYNEVGGLLAGGLAPVAPAPPVLLTTSTTLVITVPGNGLLPVPTTRPTTPTTSLPVKVSVPRPPTNLLVDFDSPSLTTRWDAVTTNTDGTAFADFRTYEVSFSAAGHSKTYETTSPTFMYSFEQNGLDFGIPQAELTVTVRAVADTGSRSEPLAGVATNDVPPTPTSPLPLVAGSEQITLTRPDEGASSDLAGFEVYESESPAGPFVLLTPPDGWDGADFIHHVPSGTTHYYVYRIRDVFGQVSPGDSPMASATAS